MIKTRVPVPGVLRGVQAKRFTLENAGEADAPMVKSS